MNILKSILPKVSNGKDRRKAQAAVEFALILPIALLLIFVIIEIARMAQGWLVVTNSARVGLRYAVTGAYETEFCEDLDGNGFACALEPDKDQRTLEIDNARLGSIKNIARVRAIGILIDDAVTDYGTPGYFHVTVCSSNDGRVYDPPPADVCIPNEHPGDPSTESARVLVSVTFEHPIILPIVNTIAPSVTLHAERTGIVEQFRVARVLGLPPVIDVPTATPAPTESPTITPTPDCESGLYYFSDFAINQYNRPAVRVHNDGPTDVNVQQFNLTWQSAYDWAVALGHNDIRVDWFTFEGDEFYSGNDFNTPTYATGNELIPAGGSGVWEIDFDWSGEGNWSFNDEFGLSADNFGFWVQLDNGCPIERPETYSPPPEANCDLYSCSDFSIGDWGNVFVDVYNGDEYGTQVTAIEFNWDYAEAFGVLVNPSNELNNDYIRYGGQTTWGGGGGAERDYDSTTHTAIDSPSSFPGNYSPGLPPFGPNTSYNIAIDMDNEWANFATDLLPTDFGVELTFANGCVLTCDPIERPLPEPNCDLYTMSSFSIYSNNHIEAFLTNGDILPAQIDRIVLDWDAAETLSDAIIGPDNLYSDWFEWDYSYIWSNGWDSIGDLSSVTDTSIDSPGVWVGPDDFEAGDTVNFEVDFDFALTSEYNDALLNWGLIPEDFGAEFYFTNGCEVIVTAVPRPIATPTPDCDNLYAPEARLRSDNFEILVRNNNTASAYLIDSTVTWPGPPPPQGPTPGEPYVNYIQFDWTTYFDTDTYYSPVNAVPSTPPEFAGLDSAWWSTDFNDGLPYGYYRGELTFEYPGWGVCIVVADLEILEPTATATEDPYATETPTRTPRPSDTSTPTATNTLPPTNTSTPTITSTPEPPTPTSPTNTPTPITPTSDTTNTSTPWPTQPGGG